MKKNADLTTYQAKHEKGEKQKDDQEFIALKLLDIKSLKRQSSYLIDTILKKKQIYAVYQTINCIESGEVYGYEGLTRPANHNVSNIIELIELADMSGKLQDLDLLMMETIIRSFEGAGLLFINIECKTPEHIKEFIEKMVTTAKENGIPTEKIVMEVTERQQWSQNSIRAINELKENHRFLLAIDDFGAGFANNSLLLNLEPDIVKIDRSLICNINENKKKYEDLKTLIESIKKRNIKIIYEGIERVEELNSLRTISHDYGQGWYFGRPKRHDNAGSVKKIEILKSSKSL